MDSNELVLTLRQAKCLTSLMIEAIESGLHGGLTKAEKWDHLQLNDEQRERVVDILKNYVMNSIEEVFQFPDELE